MKKPSSFQFVAVCVLAMAGASACSAGDAVADHEPHVVCRVSDNYVSLDRQDGPDDLDPVWIFSRDGLMDYSGLIPWAMRWSSFISVSVRESEQASQKMIVILAYEADRSSTFQLSVGPVPVGCISSLTQHLHRFAPEVQISMGTEDP